MAELSITQACELALQHHRAGRLAEAEQVYRLILARQPNHADALHLLGFLAQQTGRDDVAIELLQRAVVVNPGDAEAHNNFGNTLKNTGKTEQAIAAYRRAISIDPQRVEAIFNLGAILRDTGQFSQAIAAFRQAIALRPQLAEARHDLGMMLLLTGDFTQGWKEYEWRRRCQNFKPVSPNFAQPQWDGSDLRGRTILLYPEQGFGDILQFIRYVPLIAERGGKIIFGCSPKLQRVLRGVPGISRWLQPGESLPAFDVHCSLLSLPLAFRTTLESIPASIPYLQADAGDVERWRNELAGDAGRLKVGLVWAGRARHANDRNRSIPLAAFAPLAEVDSASFYSLQIGEAAGQLANASPGLNVIDQTKDLKDFADTAALIANLDLVISVDTAVVHLAGAMGKAVWTLLPFVPDWRWLLHRADSPWYPTMRLFRQSTIGSWEPVIREVVESLKRLAGQR